MDAHHKWRSAGNFNSRPSARGDASAEQRLIKLACYFNSRPSARGDDALQQAEEAGVISIHAPPRGATSGQRKTAPSAPFQFTPLREGRPGDRPLVVYVTGLFQFTPLREGRRHT